jgi:hypothetical protein
MNQAGDEEDAPEHERRSQELERCFRALASGTRVHQDLHAVRTDEIEAGAVDLEVAIDPSQTCLQQRGGCAVEISHERDERRARSRVVPRACGESG